MTPAMTNHLPVLVTSLFLPFIFTGTSNHHPHGVAAQTESSSSSSMTVAHIGNSMQYFNDCPRLLQKIIEASNNFDEVLEDSCINPGESIPSIFRRGNGLNTVWFRGSLLPPAYNPETGVNEWGQPTVPDLLALEEWNFVVINDHTQQAARPETRQESVDSLQNDYLPLLDTDQTTVIFLQTPAYRVEGIKNSDDLGTFEEFTDLNTEGYRAYADTVPNSQVAPVGQAYQHLRNTDVEMYDMLYCSDEYHPTPHGTYLQSCVLYCTMFGEPCPEAYDCDWWDDARYMLPSSQGPLPLPTHKEVQYLRQVANEVCNVTTVSSGENVSMLGGEIMIEEESMEEEGDLMIAATNRAGNSTTTTTDEDVYCGISAHYSDYESANLTEDVYGEV